MTTIDFAIALEDVKERYEVLPPVVHTDDPRTLLSRILAGNNRELTYEHAVHQAALALALVVAVDRAEQNSITSGDEAA